MDHKILLALPAKKEPHTAFGKRLFALRKAQGLTQVQLADALGTTQRVISYYETDAELPPAAAPSCRSRGCSKSQPISCSDLSQQLREDGSSRNNSGYGRDFRRWKLFPPRTSEPL